MLNMIEIDSFSGFIWLFLKKNIKMACNFIVLKPECDELCSYNKGRRITNFTQIEFVQRDFSADEKWWGQSKVKHKNFFKLFSISYSCETWCYEYQNCMVQSKDLVVDITVTEYNAFSAPLQFI